MYDNKVLNSCICKCGNISCRNIRVHSFKNEIPKNNNHFVYSILHHKSLCVSNSKSIVIDKCCGNYLHFHCSKCHEDFSIIQTPKSKSKFILGFGKDRLTHLNPVDCKENVVIPDFPFALRSYVFLSYQNPIEDRNLINSSIILNYSCKIYENGEDEIFPVEYDEEIMFGKDQADFVIGKYNNASIYSFGQNYSANE